MTRSPRRTFAIFLVLAAAASAGAAEPDPGGIEFFEKHVRPVLVERCYDCHSGDEPESKLRVDSLAGLMAGGTRGPALLPGMPEKSLLIRALRHDDQLQMPPKEKLSTRHIADIAAWIKMGAPWPNAQPVTAPRAAEGTRRPFTPAERSFWAFQSPAEPPWPAVRDQRWTTSPVDRFILARLEAAGLRPAQPADKRTLIRRATFDLLGLPPTPAEVQAFLDDDSPAAFARVVDRLLASPHYGERWGRRWLDVARYGDSNGLDENLAFANAFRYRDYVIAAFNRDKPYDQFVREQLAGDLLPVPEDVAHDVAAERLVATGFLALGAKMLAEDDPVKMQMDIVDEQLDTLGRALMGLTLGCARCHDHKFDPVLTEDYYALAGIFKSTKTMENFNVVARWQERPIATPDALQRQQQHREAIAVKKSEIDALTRSAGEELLREARMHVGQYLLAAARQKQLDTLSENAKPIGNDPNSAAAGDVTLVEAEDFDRGNVRKDFGSYGKDIGVLVNRGATPNFVEYDLEFEQGGLFQFELRYAAAGARPCGMSINGAVVKADAAGNVTGSWNPDGQKWFVEGFYQLEAGKNAIRLEHPQYFPHIDKLLLARVPLADGRPKVLLPPTDAAADDYEPRPAFVRQWVEHLDETAEDSKSVLAQWQRAWRQAAGLPVPAETKTEQDGESPLLADLAARYSQRFAEAEAAWRKLKAGDAGKDAEALPDAKQESFRRILHDPAGPFALQDVPDSIYGVATAKKLGERRKQLKSLEGSLPKLPETMAVGLGTAENLRVHLRGSHLTLGREVPRGFPSIIAEGPSTIRDGQSGRLELADWLTAAGHPLTARVMVNRIWQGHFGEGIVRSADNFGFLGERPTHPALLDWLALRFVESGWSVKAMHRRIMLTSAYQMSAAYDEPAAAADPENRLLWRMNRRRLEAEQIRDALLTLGGRLNRAMGGSLLKTANRKYVTSTANVNPVVYKTQRRSVYLPVVRSALYEVFQAFDFPDPSVHSSGRQSTTVAPQALFMMNSDLVAGETRALAESLLADETLDDAGRVHAAYARAYGRPPTRKEVDRALRYIGRYTEASDSSAAADTPPGRAAWQSLCRAIVSANEFLFLD